MNDTADVVVLGMGVGGELLAEQLADAGLDVVDAEVIEQVEPDGCVIQPWFVLARR
jgi:choline dehydrogenase-like flavoprotein